MQNKHGLTSLQGYQDWGMVLLCFSAVNAHSWGHQLTCTPKWSSQLLCPLISTCLFYNFLFYSELDSSSDPQTTPSHPLDQRFQLLFTNTKIFNTASKASEDICLPHQPQIWSSSCTYLVLQIHPTLNFKVHKNEIGSNNGTCVVWCQACCLE